MPGTTIKTETVFEYFNSTLDEQKTKFKFCMSGTLCSLYWFLCKS